MSLGYPSLALASFVAGSPIPMNCEVVLSALLALGYQVVPCIVVAVISNWFGASINYFLGRMCSYEKIVRWSRIKPQRLERVTQFLRGRGTWCALVSFIPFCGNALIVCFGILRAPFWKVGFWMLVGQTARFTLWAYATVALVD